MRKSAKNTSTVAVSERVTRHVTARRVVELHGRRTGSRHRMESASRVLSKSHCF
jgi:hypothetical protein